MYSESKIKKKKKKKKKSTGARYNKCFFKEQRTTLYSPLASEEAEQDHTLYFKGKGRKRSLGCDDINLYIPQMSLDYCVSINGAKHVLGENEKNNKMQLLMCFGFQRHHQFYQ